MLQSYLSHYQRVNPTKPPFNHHKTTIFLWFSYGFLVYRRVTLLIFYEVKRQRSTFLAGRRLCSLPVGDQRVKPRLQVGRWDQVRVFLSDFVRWVLGSWYHCIPESSWGGFLCCLLSVNDDLFESTRTCVLHSQLSCKNGLNYLDLAKLSKLFPKAEKQ